METRAGQSPDRSKSQHQLLTGFRWLTLLNAALMVVQAFLASQGVWGGNRDLITGHGHLGNGLFMLVAVQLVLAIMLTRSGTLPRLAIFLGGVILLLVVTQIGLGFSTRDNLSLTAWHVTNGVLLTCAMTALACVAWLLPQNKPLS